MSRYIKAEEAERRIVALWRKEKGPFADVFNTAIDACQTIILDMYDNSSQDVVPVVYCKGCVYSYPFDEEELEDPLRVGEWRCGYWGSEMHGDDYCSCGERRKKDEAD